ncbi:unnamed protein product, partial [Rotaria magnacalcarata]
MLSLLSIWSCCEILSKPKKHVKRYRDGGTSTKNKKPSFPHSSSSIEVPVNNVNIKVLIDTG